MNFRSVTAEIALTRLQRLGAQVLYVTAAAALFAALQMHSDIGAHALGAALFGSLAGIYLAVAQRGGRMRELELCEQSAPLYAREVARAIALVPSLGVVIALAGYWIVTGISSGPRDLAAAPVLLSMACACAVSIVALGATVRAGVWQAAYILLAGVVATIIVLLEYPQLPAAFLFCGIAGFIGLRQYGEALARWDPAESA
jgi:predicted membrane protein